MFRGKADVVQIRRPMFVHSYLTPFQKEFAEYFGLAQTQRVPRPNTHEDWVF
jgi:hypothetical protein